MQSGRFSCKEDVIPVPWPQGHAIVCNGRNIELRTQNSEALVWCYAFVFISESRVAGEERKGEEKNDASDKS